MTLDLTVTDMYCGAGGSTTGAVLAGADVRLAINHWHRAIETHNTNYPQTTHVLTDLHKANPRRFPSTTILLASPECTSHSLAKGKRRINQQQLALWEQGEPPVEAEAEERSRCTMWTPLDWAEYHDYQVVILENVVDAHLWRPFQSWLHAWKSLDYDFEIVYFNSMHAHPTPQSRDRMYFVAWKRKNRRPNLSITPAAYCAGCEKQIGAIQSWKNPQRRYGKYRQQYVYRCPHCAKEVIPFYYAAANAIDWSLPAPRIGERAKPLREKTLRRIEYGLRKFVQQPFTVQVNKSTNRVRPLLSEPFPTQTADNGLGIVLPFLLNLNHSTIRPTSVCENPFPTQTSFDTTSVVFPSIGASDGQESRIPFLVELHGTSQARSITEALATVCAGGRHHALVVPPFLLDHLGEYRPRSLARPISTICAAGNHHSLVIPPAWSWLMSYYQHGHSLLCAKRHRPSPPWSAMP